MPREYEMIVEIPKSKCPDCGSKNKIKTDFVDQNHKYVGYQLKCCMCGHITNHFNEHSYNGTGHRPKLKIVKEQCLRKSFCPHKDCKLYLDKTTPIKPLPPNKKQCCCKLEINLDKSPRFL